MHCQNRNAYHKNCERLRLGSQETFQKVRDKSVKTIFKEYESLGVVPDDNGVRNIAVSFDGSWQKRGHSSHNGIGSVIDLLTGLPIDFNVLSTVLSVSILRVQMIFLKPGERSIPIIVPSPLKELLMLWKCNAAEFSGEDQKPMSN